MKQCQRSIQVCFYPQAREPEQSESQTEHQIAVRVTCCNLLVTEQQIFEFEVYVSFLRSGNLKILTLNHFISAATAASMFAITASVNSRVLAVPPTSRVIWSFSL